VAAIQSPLHDSHKHMHYMLTSSDFLLTYLLHRAESFLKS